MKNRTSKRWQACSAIANCSECSPLAIPGPHFRQISGALRSVPSPEQGTSQRIRSNLTGFPSSPGTEGKAWPSWLVTTIEGVQSRLVWWVRRLHRWKSASFATTKPVAGSGPLCSISRSWTVLEPGAAHISRTLFYGGRTNGGEGERIIG